MYTSVLYAAARDGCIGLLQGSVAVIIWTVTPICNGAAADGETGLAYRYGNGIVHARQQFLDILEEAAVCLSVNQDTDNNTAGYLLRIEDKRCQCRVTDGECLGNATENRLGTDKAE